MLVSAYLSRLIVLNDYFRIAAALPVVLDITVLLPDESHVILKVRKR